MMGSTTERLAVAGAGEAARRWLAPFPDAGAARMKITRPKAQANCFTL
jgi:hypothetical protein